MAVYGFNDDKTKADISEMINGKLSLTRVFHKRTSIYPDTVVCELTSSLQNDEALLICADYESMAYMSVFYKKNNTFWGFRSAQPCFYRTSQSGTNTLGYMSLTVDNTDSTHIELISRLYNASGNVISNSYYDTVTLDVYVLKPVDIIA